MAKIFIIILAFALAASFVNARDLAPPPALSDDEIPLSFDMIVQIVNVTWNEFDVPDAEADFLSFISNISPDILQASYVDIMYGIDDPIVTVEISCYASDMDTTQDIITSKLASMPDHYVLLEMI